MIKIVFILFATVTLLCGIDLTQEEKIYLSQKNILLVNNESDWRPYDFNINGEPKGFSIDYIRLVAKKLDMPIKFVSGKSWDTYMQMIKTKELDVILNIAQTEERQKDFIFTAPYLTKLTDAIFTHVQNSSINSMQDLDGKKVAVVKGYYNEEVITKYYPNMKMVLVENPTESFKAVAFKEVDATIDDVGVGNTIINDLSLTSIVPAYIIKDKHFSLDLHLATHKDNIILKNILQKGMNEITETEIIELKKKWLLLGKKDELIDFRFAIGFVVLVLMLILALIYRNRILKSFNQKLQDAQKQLTHEVKEKEILLQELDHRVKNNLQIISSLVSLNSLRKDNSRLLDDIQNIISTISLVHNKLHYDVISNKVELSQYINSLLENYLATLNIQKIIVSDEIFLDKECATTLGIIINEFVNNSIKHGFKNTHSPIIRVEITQDNDQILCKVSDNGEGLQTTNNAKGIGMQIIQSLTKSKFKTTAEFINHNGFMMIIVIPQNNLSE